MNMAFQRKRHLIMNDTRWKKGEIVSYDLLRNAVIRQLGFSDKRSIANWIGECKIKWKKKRHSAFYPTSNEKTVEWHQGLLEEFRYVKMLTDADIEQLSNKDMYPKEYAPYFKILIDKGDIEQKNTT